MSQREGGGRMVTLRAMDPDEYDDFLARLREEYPAERARNLDTSLDEEQLVAAHQLAETLPEGRASVGHHFWKALDDDGAPVGELWVFVSTDRKRAFIYSIQIAVSRRNQGWGRRTLAALDAWLRAEGVGLVALNVFGDNPAAQHLYATSGYRVTNSAMQKRLDE